MRADARRNYDRLVAVASAVVAEQGAEASLEEIARRAGVGSATLHRHFPGRYALLDAVFQDRVDALCAKAADLLDDPSPGEALVTWLHAVVAHASANRGLAPFLIKGASAHTKIVAAGEKLLARARQDGTVQPDIDIVELLTLVNAVSLAAEHLHGQADRLLRLVVDGIRRQGG
ncbi:AcrR family transcriptional regulator [Kibdelosporangium banguiense]|uniref:AcrR family transcriptional regulator n=1 Tax=Kibdelosporangium banguiense TaxID=1365924 RepID=A0ABS4TKI1_9PSEU|nr:helix-turn-helix domain-containing protein [Kibdelosporangium banguiense]MBP2324398.1 AcrR family transcriptional regulator [Kibdelosporangium banguiense]